MILKLKHLICWVLILSKRISHLHLNLVQHFAYEKKILQMQKRPNFCWMFFFCLDNSHCSPTSVLLCEWESIEKILIATLPNNLSVREIECVVKFLFVLFLFSTCAASKLHLDFFDLETDQAVRMLINRCQILNSSTSACSGQLSKVTAWIRQSAVEML